MFEVNSPRKNFLRLFGFLQDQGRGRRRLNDEWLVQIGLISNDDIDPRFALLFSDAIAVEILSRTERCWRWDDGIFVQQVLHATLLQNTFWWWITLYPLCFQNGYLLLH